MTNYCLNKQNKDTLLFSCTENNVKVIEKDKLKIVKNIGLPSVSYANIRLNRINAALFTTKSYLYNLSNSNIKQLENKDNSNEGIMTVCAME